MVDPHTSVAWEVAERVHDDPVLVVPTDFIATGIYDIAERGFHTTPSPSMDILISSNLERPLFELTGDGEAVADWMDSLAEDGSFRCIVRRKKVRDEIDRLKRRSGPLARPAFAGMEYSLRQRMLGE